MHERIIDLIAEAAAELCWQKYQQRQRIPQVPLVLEELLRNCQLRMESDDAFERLAYATRQSFQNRLLQSRMRQGTEEVPVA